MPSSVESRSNNPARAKRLVRAFMMASLGVMVCGGAGSALIRASEQQSPVAAEDLSLNEKNALLFRAVMDKRPDAVKRMIESGAAVDNHLVAVAAGQGSVDVFNIVRAGLSEESASLTGAPLTFAILRRNQEVAYAILGQVAYLSPERKAALSKLADANGDVAMVTAIQAKAEKSPHALPLSRPPRRR